MARQDFRSFSRDNDIRILYHVNFIIMCEHCNLLMQRIEMKDEHIRMLEDRLKMKDEQYTDVKDFNLHLKQANSQQLNIISNGTSGSRGVSTSQEFCRITTPVFDVLNAQDKNITDDELITHLEMAYPAYQGIASLVLIYTKDRDNIVFNRRNNTFQCLEDNKIQTFAKHEFIKKVLKFMEKRAYNLVVMKMDIVASACKGGSHQDVDLEYTKDTNRAQNLSTIKTNDTNKIEQIYTKFKILYV